MFDIAQWSLLTILALFNSNAGALINDIAEDPSQLVRNEERILQQINDNDLVSKLYDQESNHWTTPWENVSTRYKRDVTYEKTSQNSNPEITSEPAPVEFDKRNQVSTKNTPIFYEATKPGVGWWPWSSGLSPVRRSFFVPRLGKRFSNEDPEGSDAEITPADTQILKDLLSENTYFDGEDDEGDEGADADESLDDLPNYEDTELPSRVTRAYAFVPRLGKKAYSFAPRLGKKAYSFAPRLGKKSYTFAPRLGKRAYTFAPRLGKRKFSFSPRLGKRDYSFAPRLGKKAYSFAPRLGKKAYSFAPRLG